MSTELGKFIRIQCINKGINQKELAVNLDISAATLSNYMNGNTVPEMDILYKCIERFNLSSKDIKDFFTKAFKSSGQHNKKIILDTQFLTEERLNLLVQALVVLLCNPLESSSSINNKLPSNSGDTFYYMKERIEECYGLLR
jgi:transcriptional regulator with XRE-family HTH domain